MAAVVFGWVSPEAGWWAFHSQCSIKAISLSIYPYPRPPLPSIFTRPLLPLSHPMTLPLPFFDAIQPVTLQLPLKWQWPSHLNHNLLHLHLLLCGAERTGIVSFDGSNGACSRILPPYVLGPFFSQFCTGTTLWECFHYSGNYYERLPVNLLVRIHSPRFPNFQLFCQSLL